MQAVAGQLFRRDVVPEPLGLDSLDHEVPEHVDQILLCLGDVAAAMQRRREFVGAMALPAVSDEGVGLQDDFEPLAGCSDTVTELCEARPHD